LLTAQREFEKETGLEPAGPFIPLQPVKQKESKVVHAWVSEGDYEPTSTHGNTFTMEWPPKSGHQKQLPGIDQAELFDLDAATRKIKLGLVGLIDELEVFMEND
jgi:predicted NUDIX family NTP pyrophosphohydrolase